MKTENLKKMNQEELYDLAREYEIKGRTDMTREQLVDALYGVMIDSGQTQIEADMFDLGTPIIGGGTSNKKLPSSLTNTQEIKKVLVEDIKKAYSPYFDGDPLPETYGDNKIILMPKNPQWAYTYWEITADKIDEIQGLYGDKLASSKSAIRVYDVTFKDFDGVNANSYFDISLPENVREWFIGGLNPKSSYVADIGLLTTDGQFITIARSASISTPSDSISNNIDEEWMIVEEWFKKILERSSGGRIVNGKWIGGMGASGTMLGASEEMVAVMMRRLFLEKGSKREKILAHLEKAMGSISAGSLTAGSLSLSQGNIEKTEAEGELQQKNFWLKVGTELILYGATEPDANVTVMGKKINLRPDGTFSFRYALPVGHYELPVIAVSVDGDDTRQITPIVDRTEV